MKRILFAVSISVGLITTVTVAGDLTTAEEVMKFSIEKSDSYKTFAADLTQSITMMGMPMTVTGHIEFKQPALMRFDMQMPMMGQTQTVLGVMGPDKVVWQEMHMGGMTQVMKIDFQNIPTNSAAAAAVKNPFEGMDPKQQWLSARKKYDFKLAGTSDLRGQKMYVVVGTPKPTAQWTPQESAMGVSSATDKVYVGQQDGFMHRMELLDKNGTNTLMTMEFTNLRFNVDIPDSQFVYKPAPGVQVMDMTQMIQQMGASPLSPAPTTQ
jgi:outer membrane lipoprotein-sorting protein